MTRHVSRRAVVKLAYAAPVVAVSMHVVRRSTFALSGDPPLPVDCATKDDGTRCGHELRNPPGVCVGGVCQLGGTVTCLNAFGCGLVSLCGGRPEAERVGLCAPTIDGGTACLISDYCGGPTHATCDRDTECPSGMVCAIEECNCTVFHCIRLWPTGAAV